MITNAVRCVPPENKPTPAEIGTCRPFLVERIAAMPRLAAVVALGRIAHDSTLAALGARKAAFPFAHGARTTCGRARAVRQLPLLALQHQYRQADAARCSAPCSARVAGTDLRTAGCGLFPTCQLYAAALRRSERWIMPSQAHTSRACAPAADGIVDPLDAAVLEASVRRLR